MDNTMKEYEHRQLELCVNMNVKLVRNMYSPKLRLLAQVGLLPRTTATLPSVLGGVIRIPLAGHLRVPLVR